MSRNTKGTRVEVGLARITVCNKVEVSTTRRRVLNVLFCFVGGLSGSAIFLAMSLMRIACLKRYQTCKMFVRPAVSGPEGDREEARQTGA